MNALLKVVLIGDAGVGKTALLTQFISKQFREKYKTTIGADFLTREVMIGDKLVTLQLWDTAGQERFNSLGAAFFRGADICILIFDLTRKDSLDHLPNWKQEFLDQAGIDDQAYPFVCLGNKADLESSRVITTEKARDFCTTELGAVSFYETSAKTAENVERAFIAAASYVLSKASTAKPKKISEDAAPQVDLHKLKPNAPETGESSCCS